MTSDALGGDGASGGRPAWQAVRARLEAAGFRPSRRLGQNFLLDENMLRAIVRDADVSRDDVVLEVGPGCGFLTLHLAREAGRVVSVEIDPRLLEIARELCAEATNVQWIRADVLASKQALAPEVDAALPRDRSWKLVANLPYSVSAPLLAVLAGRDVPPDTMTVLVQREVAERVVAAPGTNDWGPLSIRLQLDYAARVTRTVPAQLFWPRPEVESAVVRLDRRKDARGTPDARRAFEELVRALFQRRRQGLARVLADRFDRAVATRALGELGLDPRARAEDLGIEPLWALSERLRGGPAA